MTDRTVADIGEHALIARITARLSMPGWVVVGPGDDAAVLEPERGTLDVLTTDTLVDGVHFDSRFVPPDAIGHRALAANLSDLAAMGARPRALLLSFVLPDHLDITCLDGIVDGLLALAGRYRLPLVGGNITRTPGPLTIDITAVGSVHRRRILRRSGARPGDDVYVTGTVGSAAAGLISLRAVVTTPDDPDLVDCQQRYLRPDPRLRAGHLLAAHHAATACMDLSDGLADAVRQVSTASGVGMRLDAALIPVAPRARDLLSAHGWDPVRAAVAGGDDYELLFTARPSARRRLQAVVRQLGDVPITRIGVVTRVADVVLDTASGPQDLPAGFEHFRQDGALRHPRTD
jgi:thiamine-monophosphate kinase